jgi:hypothetical protein
MKVVIAVFVTVLVLVPAAFATGQALDPRVPGLQKQVRLLKGQMAAVQGQMSQKLDRSCVEIVQAVIRPGYVYQAADGTLVIYKAFDAYDASTDSSFNSLMQLKAGC